MDLADEWLGVPKLLTPEDFVSPNVDEQSMLTYLSQFPNAKLAPGAPLRKKTNAGKVSFFFSYQFFTSLVLLKCQMMHKTSLALLCCYKKVFRHRYIKMDI